MLIHLFGSLKMFCRPIPTIMYFFEKVQTGTVDFIQTICINFPFAVSRRQLLILPKIQVACSENTSSGCVPRYSLSRWRNTTNLSLRDQRLEQYSAGGETRTMVLCRRCIIGAASAIMSENPYMQCASHFSTRRRFRSLNFVVAWRVLSKKSMVA